MQNDHHHKRKMAIRDHLGRLFWAQWKAIEALNNTVYSVGHKKRAALFWTIAAMFLGRFLLLVPTETRLYLLSTVVLYLLSTVPMDCAASHRVYYTVGKVKHFQKNVLACILFYT